ncbi:MAG: hypothetical protein HKN72_15265, partial [Gemmatimonadetes bacterium]|nr:hypothetical protein [Gemmatimonadota bacterium]
MRAARLLPLFLSVLVTWSCSESGAGPVMDDDGPDEYPDLSEMPVALSVVTGPPPAVCGEPTVVGLRLGPDISTGSVTVANDEENLYVTYRSDGGPILG